MGTISDDENYEKPFFLEEQGVKLYPNHLDKHPNYPDVTDDEIEAFDWEDSGDENKPLDLKGDDLKFEPDKPDLTYIPPWLRKDMPPLTKALIREAEEIRNKKCYIDDDPRNLWLYKEYHGPVIQTVVRQEWGAKGWKPKKPLNVPVKHIRFTYTGGPTDNYPEAIGILQDLQKKHREEGLDDIALNYYISKDGAIFEGRGWYVDAHRPPEFAHLKGDCLDVAYLGDYSKADPPWYLLQAAVDVIRYAVEIRVLDPNFKVIQYRPLDHLRNLK